MYVDEFLSHLPPKAGESGVPFQIQMYFYLVNLLSELVFKTSCVQSFALCATSQACWNG